MNDIAGAKPINHPFLRQIDHVGIHADDPEALFRFFAETLGLPVVFPYIAFGPYAAAGVSLGNAFLEVSRFGPRAPHRTRARPFILGFLVHPGGLPAASVALDKRGIERSGITPMYAPQAASGDLPVWENVYLGDVFGASAWTRVFFAATRRARATPDVQRSALAALLLPGLLHRAFPNGMAVLTDYLQVNDDRKRTADRDALRAVGGGQLGVVELAEVAVGAPAGSKVADAWRRLLAPVEPGTDGARRLGDGPAIRSSPDHEPGLARITLRVASLDRAEQAACGMAIPLRADADGLAVSIPTTEGLLLRLIDAADPGG